MKFHHETTGVDPTCRVPGTVPFELQLVSKSDQGIIADDFTPEPLKEGSVVELLPIVGIVISV